MGVYNPCNVCPRRCGVDRSRNLGVCRMPDKPVVARAALHTGEEPCISGAGGSGTIFFSGCSLRCLYCQNYTISHELVGKAITPIRLASIFLELEEAGAQNINLVNPTHFVPSILEAAAIYRPRIPFVYNSSGYEEVHTLRLLEGWMDVYLPDIKYADEQLGRQFSGAPDYFEKASQAVLEMVRQTGPMQIDEQGMAKKGTMVRHLVLPGHTRNSMAVLDWMAEHLPAGVWVSLMFQYTPLKSFEYPELNRTATARECRKVWEHMLQLGLTDGYVQDRSSVGEQYIPTFDFTGV